MAKTLVIDPSDGIRTPFLRGILTRSLTDAGLAFEAAYKLSSDIRQQISGDDEITTEEVRRRVLSALQKLDEKEVIENYESVNPSATKVMVIERKGDIEPFSIIKHRRMLESTGLSSDKAAYISQIVFNELVESYQDAIQSMAICKLTYDKLKQHYGKEAATRYLVWIDYKIGRAHV